MAAADDAGVDLTLLLATCHMTVNIVTEEASAPLVGKTYGSTLTNPLTGVPMTLE